MVLAIEEARVPCIGATARVHRCTRQSDEDASPNRDGRTVEHSVTQSGRVSEWTGWHACRISHRLQFLVTMECSIECGLHGYGCGLHTWQAGKPAVSVLCCLAVLCLIV